MSYIGYRWATAQIGDPPFCGIVMLAMMRADTANLARLRAAWPDVYEELQARYNAPGAVLPSDPEGLRVRVAASLGVTVEALS